MAVTMREVAKAAGVSVATVSYVLTQRPDVAISRSTRERVFHEARRLNYRYNALAADLRRGATRVVGIQIYSLGVSILARKVAALEQALREAGYYPFLCHAIDLDAEQTFFKECASRRVCGLVLTAPPRPESRRYLSRLIDQGVVIVSSEPIPELAIPYMTVDRGRGAEAAVRHLIALGHRRIAAVIGFTGQAREAFEGGYRAGLAGGGIAFDPERVLDLEEGVPYHESGDRAVERLQTLSDPVTAILTTDDEVAIGALRALQRRGLRVPADMALIGCDDIPAAAYPDVPLTTLAQPAEEVGAGLAKLFLDGLEDPTRIAGHRGALPLRLVVRQSCGAIGQASVGLSPGTVWRPGSPSPSAFDGEGARG